tara:strand:- start:226 stop:795 length:570 start_codon:yes stop_codon:yes gene_type:complete
MNFFSLLIAINSIFSVEPDLDLQSFHDLTAVSIEGDIITMEAYRGKKILVVNVASKCGYTPQYEGLQKLYITYKEELVVLGFPSNNFLWQEPGTDQAIQLFCRLNYGVTFPMFSKVHVKGKKQHPVYQWLTDSKLNGWNDEKPSWNFYKYLIDENGKLLTYFGSQIVPLDTAITNYFLQTPNSSIPMEK